ncbi:MAG: PilZ domain-containing protein [Deltaproteobacteria bacterium]|nr:PilZ domain-containing protein [Deltaproteobacteria bacterium]
MWERRNEERVKLRIWVEERVGETVYYQRTANISRSGLFLEGTIPHEPGTRVRLSFSLPDMDDVIDLEGEVVGAGKDQTGMGIRIVDIRDEDAERLEAFLKDHLGE